MKYTLLTACFLFVGSFVMAQQNSTQPKGKLVNAKAPENKSKSKTSSTSVDPTFPKYVDTGNPEKDRDTYKAAKAEWIKKNPEKYEAMKTGNSTPASSSGARQKPVVVRKNK